MTRAFTVALLFLALLATTSALMAQKPLPSDKGQAAVQTAQANDPIDFNRARELLQKRNRGEKLSADEEAYLRRAMEARGKGPKRDGSPTGGKDKMGFKPLTDMTADDRYQGQDGGLYGGGKNTPPDAHRRAAEAELARIQPLDASGKPSADGQIVLVSISMSNATQEFSTFKPLADADPAKSPRVTIVDCAQGGQAMAEWVSPEARAWQETDRRLANAKVSHAQVQVAWIKLANKSPSRDLETHGRQLQRDTQAVIQNAKKRFPNLRIAYLSSRIYGGYSGGSLNPEPYAYESGFVCRWLIQDQIKGSAELNYTAEKGAVKAPLLLWGPYLWADGVTPRQTDKLVWTRDDLGPDGTHPSPTGRQKVAQMLLSFFKTDPLAAPWFTRGKSTAAAR